MMVAVTAVKGKATEEKGEYGHVAEREQLEVADFVDMAFGVEEVAEQAQQGEEVAEVLDQEELLEGQVAHPAILYGHLLVELRLCAVRLRQQLLGRQLH